MVTEHVARIVAGPVVLRGIAVPSLHVLHVVYESLAVVVVIVASVGRILSLGKALRRRSRSLRVLTILAPNAILRANAKLLHVALGVCVVILDEIAPGLLDRIIARVLELSTPVGEPVADLGIGETRLVGQLLLLLPIWVRIVPPPHEPVFEHAFDFRREEPLDRSVDVAWWPYLPENRRKLISKWRQRKTVTH